MSNPREIVGYDGSKYRNGREMARTARLDIDKLPVSDEVKHEVLRIATNITTGSLRASDAIQNPFRTAEELYSAVEADSQGGTPGDYDTDRKGLEELPDFFNPQRKFKPNS